MSDARPSEQLVDLAMLGLEHGVRSVSEGGPLIPFTFEEGPKGRMGRRFVAETLEESAAAAHDHAAGLRGKADRVAIALDGYITVEGTRSDAIIVHAYESGDPVTYVFAQVYIPAEGKREATPEGSPRLIERSDPLF